MPKKLPPKGIRAILVTLFKPPSDNDGFNEIDYGATANEAVRLYEAGHRVIITTGGFASGYDISQEQVVAVAEAVSDALAGYDDVWIYVGCVTGFDRCTTVALRVRDLPNVKGLLLLPNRHPHGDPTGDGWLEFYKILSEVMEFPYIIYRVSQEMTDAHYDALANDPYFVELKWATILDVGLIPAVIGLFEGRVNVSCGLGDLNGPEWVKKYGVVGWTWYTVNAAPYLCKQLEIAVLDGQSTGEIFPPIEAFEKQRFGPNICWNNRLVVVARLGFGAYLPPPHRKYDHHSRPAAETAISQLEEAEDTAQQAAA